MDGARYDHLHVQVCGREDADGGFVAAWKSALDGQGTGDGDGVRHGAVDTPFQDVVYISEFAVRGSGQVAR